VSRLAINGRFYAARVTGVQRFAREVTARLCGHVETTLLLPRGPAPPPAVAASARIVRGRLRGHVWEQIEAPALARAADCDVLLNLSGTAPVRGGPHVVVLHDVLPLTHPHWFSWRFARWYRFVLHRAAPRAAAIITVSEWSKREIVRTLGVEASRVFVVRQGIGPFDAPAPADTVRAVRSRWQLPDGYVLAIGAGDPRKNTGFLAAVGEAWQRRWPDPPALVVVGEPTPRVYGRRRVEPGHARLVGRVTDDELRALYSGAAAVCFPSKAEGFGRAPLEAASCGVPCIAADYASARETLGGCALIVPLDAARWAESLRELLHDTGLRERLVARGRELTSRMSWDACAARVLDVCRAAALGGRPDASATTLPRREHRSRAARPAHRRAGRERRSKR
jgi:glycosyltransferase involved in cell wall biosynthesis